MCALLGPLRDATDRTSPCDTIGDPSADRGIDDVVGSGRRVTEET
jgi:hypothetical protein